MNNLDGTDLLQVISITAALIIGFLPNIKSIRSSDGKINRFGFGMIILFAISLLTAFFSTLAKSSSDKDDYKNLFAETNSTLTKSNENIHKSDSILNLQITSIDKLAKLQHDAITISDSLNQQLLNQKEIDYKAEILVNESKNLLARQNILYENTNRTLYPLFPLTFGIEFYVPFSSPSLAPLVKYLWKIKSEMDSGEKSTGIWSKGWADRTGTIEFPMSFSDIEVPLNFDSLLALSFEITIVRGSYKNVHEITPSSSRMRFGAPPYYNEKRDIYFTTYYREKVIKFLITYHDFEYQNDIWGIPTSNAIIGANELLNAYVLISYNVFQGTNVELSSLTFPQRRSIHQPLFMTFSKTDTINDKTDFNHLKYFHKITEKDITFDDSEF